NSRATTAFCWFPPDSVDAGTSSEGVRMSKVAIASRPQARIARSGPTPPPAAERRLVPTHPLGEGGSVVRGEHEVVVQREAQNQPEPVPIARDMGKACLGDRSDGMSGDVEAGHRDLAADRLAQPGQHLDELVLPVARDAR